MVRPITLCPSTRSMAATVEESTPPDMATAMVSGIMFTSSSWLWALGSFNRFVFLWMMTEIDQHYMSDKSGGEPESRFHQPFKSRCHLPKIPQGSWAARIVVLSIRPSQKLKTKSEESVSDTPATVPADALQLRARAREPNRYLPRPSACPG